MCGRPDRDLLPSSVPVATQGVVAVNLVDLRAIFFGAGSNADGDEAPVFLEVLAADAGELGLVGLRTFCFVVVVAFFFFFFFFAVVVAVVVGAILCRLARAFLAAAVPLVPRLLDGFLPLVFFFFPAFFFCCLTFSPSRGNTGAGGGGPGGGDGMLRRRSRCAMCSSRSCSFLLISRNRTGTFFKRHCIKRRVTRWRSRLLSNASATYRPLRRVTRRQSLACMHTMRRHFTTTTCMRTQVSHTPAHSYGPSRADPSRS